MVVQPRIIFYNFFYKFLMTSSLFLLTSCRRQSSALAASIFSTSISISSASISLGPSTFFQVSSSCSERLSCSYLFLAARALAFLAFCARLPSSSGFSNLLRMVRSSSQMTPGVALAMCSICALLRCMPRRLRTLVVRVFQFSIFLARELAGGQLCRLTSLGLQWWMSSAIMTPSAKSRCMFFLAREKGMLSTISYTSCSSYSCIQILQTSTFLWRRVWVSRFGEVVIIIIWMQKGKEKEKVEKSKVGVEGGGAVGKGQVGNAEKEAKGVKMQEVGITAFIEEKLQVHIQEGLKEVVHYRPQDPIKFLGQFLLKRAENIK